MLPLVTRVQKSFQGWLQPGFEPSRFDYNGDRLEALATERASEWDRVGGAAFLTLDEQREALGYGPAPKDAFFAKWRNGFEARYSPSQPRVPAGSAEGGQWTSGGGGSHSNTESPSSSNQLRLAGGFKPEQLDMTVQDFVSNYCVGSINSELTPPAFELLGPRSP